MKRMILVVMFCFFPIFARAQEPSPEQGLRLNPGDLVAVESITIRSGHKVSWILVIGEGTPENFKIRTKSNLEIDLQSAVMTVDGKTRQFQPFEAALVQKIIDTVTFYTSESTKWWLQEQSKDLQRKTVSGPDVVAGANILDLRGQTVEP